jgi:hypothetical protein
MPTSSKKPLNLKSVLTSYLIFQQSYHPTTHRAAPPRRVALSVPIFSMGRPAAHLSAAVSKGHGVLLFPEKEAKSVVLRRRRSV